jgi:predicted secreted protein
MSIGSALAIYFIMWWVVLFAVLPFGVRSAHETGTAVEEGHDAGAPMAPRLLKKAAITTVISAALFAGFVWLINSGAINLGDLWGPPL